MYIQIITVILSLYLIARMFRQHKKGALSFHEACAWSLVWLGAALAVLFPKTIDAIASGIGLQSASGIDLVVYVAVALLFFLVYRVFVRLEKLERDITVAVRNDALLRAQKNDNNSK